MRPNRRQVTKWPLCQRVEVEWRDAQSRGGWSKVPEYKERFAVGPMRSIGYVVIKDHNVIQLAQSMSSVTQDITETITIPRESVTSIKRLKSG